MSRTHLLFAACVLLVAAYVLVVGAAPLPAGVIAAVAFADVAIAHRRSRTV